MIYPIQSAIGRNQVIHYACWRAIDAAMRKLHDANPTRDHARMKTDPTRCKWCGVAAAEARAELEENDE